MEKKSVHIPNKIGRRNQYSKSEKYIDLRGKIVKDHKELACLLKDWRNPKRELFHTVYLNQRGKILAHTAITSGSVNSVYIPFKEQYKMKCRANRLKAQKIYNAHNHPSGSAIPSYDDVRLTKALAQYIRGYKGHLVLDHNMYSLISPDGKVAEYKVNLGKSYSSTGKEILNASDALKVFYHHYQFEEGKVGILILNTHCQPIALEKRRFRQKNLQKMINELLSKHNGVHIMLGMMEKDKQLLLAMKTRFPWLLDVIHRNQRMETHCLLQRERENLIGYPNDVVHYNRVFENGTLQHPSHRRSELQKLRTIRKRKQEIEKNNEMDR